MRYLLAGAGAEYEHRLAFLVGFFCQRRLLGSGSVLGLMDGGSLAGVALLDGVDESVDDEAQRDLVRRLAAVIGGEAMERLRAYDEAAEELIPDGVYHYLGMLGVRRASQGAGVGRRLVEASFEHVRAEPRSAGVCLHTEQPGNVPLYEHLGFEVVAEADVGPLHTWCMFWSRGRGGSG